MRKFTFLIFAVLVFVLVSCEKQDNTIVTSQNDESALYKSGNIIPGQYVVVFNEEVAGLKSKGATYKINLDKVSEKGADILAKANIKPRKFLQTYASAIEGFALNLSDSEVAELRKQPGIKVYADEMCQNRYGNPHVDPVQPPQSVPYGIERVGYDDYTGTHLAWIIDTGIDYDHPDLNVDTTLAKTFVFHTTTAEDDHGHGTHCAGILAAKNNSIGVIGVAANAYVVPVKVLDHTASGPWSVIIAGIDYVAANATPGDVANISIVGHDYDPVDLAVINLGLSGVFVGICAGNDRDDANNHSPGRAEGVNLYTVSACDINDSWAWFSNYGNPPIEFCAPGVNVYSTYLGGTYTTMNGTSMATPHVCGLLLITNGNVKIDGYVNGDPDGNPDPIAHK